MNNGQLLRYIQRRTPDAMLASRIADTFLVPTIHDVFVPPLAVQVAANRGITKRAAITNNLEDGCTLNLAAGLTIAHKLVSGKPLSEKTICKMHRYFKSKATDGNRLLYGGKAGRKWVAKIVASSVRGPIIDNIIHIRSIRDIDLAIKKYGMLRAMLFDKYMDAWNSYDYSHLHYTEILGGGGIKLSIERGNNLGIYLVEFNVGNNDVVALNDIKNNKFFKQVFKGKQVNFGDNATGNYKVVIVAKEFEEDQHPRADDGEFAPKNGGGISKQHHIAATKDKDGKHRANDGGELPDHIKALKIPPAWTNVHYSPDVHGSLLVTGKDSKGRSQAIYSLKHNQDQAEAKFARIKELSKKYKSIEKQNAEARQSTNPHTKAAADCAYLIMKTGIRPGSDSDTGAKEKAYGATNMLGKHVVEHNGKVRLQFTGKKGVKLDLPVHDKDVAKMLLERKAKAGDDGKLFNTNERNLLEHVHSYDGGSFKTKDFRTHLANNVAMKEIAKIDRPKNAQEYKKKVMDVAKIVSKHLGNTATIALTSYINPSVFAQWRTQISDDKKTTAKYNLTHRHVGITFKRTSDDNIKPHADIAKQFDAKFASEGDHGAKVMHHIYKVPVSKLGDFKTVVKAKFPTHKVKTIKKY